MNHPRGFSRKLKPDEHSQHVILNFLSRHHLFKQNTGGFPPQLCSGSKNHCAVLANLLSKSDHNKIRDKLPVFKKIF